MTKNVKNNWSYGQGRDNAPGIWIWGVFYSMDDYALIKHVRKILDKIEKELISKGFKGR